jgi:hypothetical protein
VNQSAGIRRDGTDPNDFMSMTFSSPEPLD